MVSLPVLTPFAELLKGTVTEEFKKLLQPTQLVAAGLFMVLNLALILPVLVSHGIPPFADLQTLPAVWQLALGTLALLALGYLIGSLKGIFLGILAGDAFRESPLVYRWLKERQETEFNTLDETLADLSSEKPITEEQKEAVYRLAYEFPNEREALAATGLGNAQRSVASYAWHQHGAHLDTLWPFIDPLLEQKDKELHTRIGESQQALTFLATIVLLLALVALELAVVGAVFVRPLLAILGTLTTLLAAYGAYQAAIKQTLAWGRHMRAAFDLHLDDLAEVLGLCALPKEDLANRKRRWEDISAWLAYGAIDVRRVEPAALNVPAWCKDPSPDPVFEVVHPATLKVEKYRTFRRGETPDLDGSAGKRFYGQVGDYVFVIANAQEGEHAHTATGAYLLVADGKMLPGQRIEGRFTDTASTPAPNSQRVTSSLGDPSTLSWPLDDVSPWHSLVLCYTARHKDEVIAELKPRGTTSAVLSIKSLGPGKSENSMILVANSTRSATDAQLTIRLPEDDELPKSVSLQAPKQKRLDMVSKPSLKELQVDFVAPKGQFRIRFKRRP